MWKFDTHCDVLLKLWESEGKIDFYCENDDLHVHYPNMVKSDILVQTFAVFVPPSLPVHNRFHTALEMVDLFYEKIIRDQKQMRLIRTSDDLKHHLQKKDKPGAILSLEGADALQGNLTYLRTLYRSGVRSIGLTWNYRNEAADGVEEPSPGGLSQFGRELVQEAARLNMIVDISHLSEKGFWDLAENFQIPIMASHSNCKSIHNHPRNLTDEQIKTIIHLGGVIGMTFVPGFIADKENVSVTDLLKHIEHICSLGGENHIGFGSDFDGISDTMIDLTDSGEYHILQEALLKHYPEHLVRRFLCDNWAETYQKLLPA
ncbi:MAG: membrane dipeptidase [Bacillaceae bacterium]|nr:membrane dipeptidase [Bacillaceae bacterium]